MNGLEMRSKFKRLYKKRVIIDTCTITDLIELNATYLPLEFFQKFMFQQIFLLRNWTSSKQMNLKN
ncbi:hypothetical protein Clst_0415 [Thermoclostridium stercorarium subsp. stercorarium DSM 8532]|nr:hypothetical protein Clst_0415 [Thermoclostridium stercorarium subsp. stercorarium DSM 8532]